MGGSAGGVAQMGLGGLQLLEAKNQSDSIKRQSEFNARQAEFNAELTGMQIKEVESQSRIDIKDRESQVNQMIGDQKVAFAGQGVDLDSEVVGLIEDEERRVGREDVQSIKNNAWREAMGLEIEQRDQRSSAQLTRLEGREASRSTLVSGGLGAIGSGVDGFSKFSSKRSGKNSRSGKYASGKNRFSKK